MYSNYQLMQKLNYTFYWTLKWFCTKVGYAVAFQVFCSCERLPTAFYWTRKSPVIFMFPTKEGNHQWQD